MIIPETLVQEYSLEDKIHGRPCVDLAKVLTPALCKISISKLNLDSEVIAKTVIEEGCKHFPYMSIWTMAITEQNYLRVELNGDPVVFEGIVKNLGKLAFLVSLKTKE